MISRNKILNIFAENVRKHRRVLGISQEELAFRANLHRTYIGMIERAEKNITLVNMVKIANALEVKINYDCCISELLIKFVIRKLNQKLIITMKFNFNQCESDFYQYLKKFGNVNQHSITNYISWLRFLSNYYSINSELSDNYIEEIINQEKLKRDTRLVYRNVKDLTNFRSALRKYLMFLKSDIETEIETEIKDEIINIEINNELSITEKSTLMLARVGQGKFRKQLIEYWNGCSITGFNRFDLLVASHIKPWKDSNNSERIDVYNGLLLLPNYDKLFDRGYINFDRKGKILFSKLISDNDKNTFGLSDNVKLINLEVNHIKYLEFHRENCFMK
ncbi:MAG: helix-turn-helix domain-containing protein [Bacteroidales bacterium]